ncbi:hypothetical protein B0T10DRAFT_288408 [Thelonectria olida]|uniref:CSI2 protein n=1 Tax=Thelonectria olida TaxID=1576542 RepID=A0A9P9ANL5_9HYPO|nr:hypothetical protein B0T10DRAFT_288408 [Thelonectria olida]
MRPANFLPRAELLLTSLASVSLFGAVAYAADETNSDSAKSTGSSNNDDSSSDNDSKSTNNEETASKTTDNSAQTTATQEDKASTTAEPESTSEKAESTTEKAETTTSDEPSSTSEESESSATEDIESTISSVSSSSKSEAALTGMPTLTGVYAVPTYPAPSVPPTNNAPFMQHSSAPDGTIFIAVGAILGAFGISILLWRVIVGFLLHRSVERAAKAQHDANVKTGFPAPPAPFYKYTDNASTMSLSAGRGVRRTTRGPILSSTPSASNLFFSPTAAASGGAGGNRASAFLPSGFYAAGTSSPGGNHEHSISLTNLRPDSRGQYGNPSRNTLGTTPPDSPSFNSRRDISNTSLNLTRPPSQRAPSAFLDDLLADDPSALPPPHMPGSQRHSSHSNIVPGSQNRF